MTTTKQAQELLVEFGSTHVKTLVFLAVTILVIGILSFFVLFVFNKRKPVEERKSNFSLFLYSLLISFFATVLFFVYKFVAVGFSVLIEKQ
ncbi:MAG: hypothetical protein GXO22_08350 [Aquificae bacterium]|nr:hypothetical protein [Aquificota bacterium]